MNWTSLPIQHLLTKVACIAVYTADLLRMSSRSARSSLPREREENERVLLMNLFQNSELSILNIIDYSGARSTDEARRHQSLILGTFGNPLSFSRLCISREQNIFYCFLAGSTSTFQNRLSFSSWCWLPSAVTVYLVFPITCILVVAKKMRGKREKYNIKSAEHTFKHMDGDFRVSCG